MAAAYTVTLPAISALVQGGRLHGRKDGRHRFNHAMDIRMIHSWPTVHWLLRLVISEKVLYGSAGLLQRRGETQTGTCFVVTLTPRWTIKPSFHLLRSIMTFSWGCSTLWTEPVKRHSCIGNNGWLWNGCRRILLDSQFVIVWEWSTRGLMMPSCLPLVLPSPSLFALGLLFWFLHITAH